MTVGGLDGWISLVIAPILSSATLDTGRGGAICTSRLSDALGSPCNS